MCTITTRTKYTSDMSCTTNKTWIFAPISDYLETRNLGESLHTITGHKITPPLTDFSHPARVEDRREHEREGSMR